MTDVPYPNLKLFRKISTRLVKYPIRKPSEITRLESLYSIKAYLLTTFHQYLTNIGTFDLLVNVFYHLA